MRGRRVIPCFHLKPSSTRCLARVHGGARLLFIVGHSAFVDGVIAGDFDFSDTTTASVPVVAQLIQSFPVGDRILRDPFVLQPSRVPGTVFPLMLFA